MRKIAFIVNGSPEGAMGRRAESFAAHLRHRFDIRVFYRSINKVRATVEFAQALLNWDPAAAYVFDFGYSGILAATAFKVLRRRPLVADTGDAIYALAKSTGFRGPIGACLTAVLEEFSLRAADRIVVRGTYHREILARRGVMADLVQDGVSVQQFASPHENNLRKAWNAEGSLTIGFVGSSIWSERLGICSGWELVELLHLLRGVAVIGVVIGDGTGIQALIRRGKELGVSHLLRLVGRIPYDELPRALRSLDICLSTQSDDIVGRVRTTGKLPLYMAAGRYVLASRVGEAARVLPEEMLVPYQGVVDRAYPARLAERVFQIVAQPERLMSGRKNVDLARHHFEYSVLAKKVGSLLDDVLTAKTSRC